MSRSSPKSYLFYSFDRQGKTLLTMVDEDGFKVDFEVTIRKDKRARPQFWKYNLHEDTKKLGLCFADKFSLQVGDLVGICVDRSGQLIIDCHTAAHPCPAIRSAAVRGADGSSLEGDMVELGHGAAATAVPDGDGGRIRQPLGKAIAAALTLPNLLTWGTVSGKGLVAGSVAAVPSTKASAPAQAAAVVPETPSAGAASSGAGAGRREAEFSKPQGADGASSRRGTSPAKAAAAAAAARAAAALQGGSEPSPAPSPFRADAAAAEALLGLVDVAAGSHSTALSSRTALPRNAPSGPDLASGSLAGGEKSVGPSPNTCFKAFQITSR